MAATQQAVIFEAQTPEIPEHEQIASLAYTLWQQRGCPEGSPETDWFLAEQRSLEAKRSVGETRNKRKNGRSHHTER
jgi:hypothetical protein